MQYRVVIALKDTEDMYCVQAIVDTMSFSFDARPVSPEPSEILDGIGKSSADLLILDLTASPEMPALAMRLRREHRGLWMILLEGEEENVTSFCLDRRSIVLQKPISTMRMLHALHSAVAGMEQEIKRNAAVQAGS